MCTRIIIALILITLTSFPATSRTRLQTDDEQEQDSSVWPYDRYEAQEIARTFKEELEKGNDISPLIDRYFVSDFDERFAREAADNFWFPAKPKALAQADKEDVRRYYIALTNFEFLYLRLGFTLERQQKVKMIADGGQGDEEVREIEKLFPKDVVDALNSNPFLAGLAPSDAKAEPTESTETAIVSDKCETSKSETDSDILEHNIRTLEQLRDLSSAMEIASKRMRDYLNTLPADKTALDYIMPKEDASETTHPSFAVGENAYISEEASFYGFPEGTRFVCARVLYLHIDMIRIDGELKVLSVYMPVSD